MAKKIRLISTTANRRMLKAWSLILWVVLTGLAFLTGCNVISDPISVYGPGPVLMYGAPYKQFTTISQMMDK
jgi:hypothetical protein